ncbi:MAG: hypothetical protein ACK47N_01695 [Microcystis sp.]|nr:hypothetical protein [Microcystis aeruginosa]UZO77340.1 hypothetical protein M8120_04965 [Microcystis aeruginosa str. Chao 1910]
MISYQLSVISYQLSVNSIKWQVRSFLFTDYCLLDGYAVPLATLKNLPTS